MNALTKNQASEVSTNVLSMQEWESSEINSTDIIIPKILPMQGLSEFVTEGKAKFGDFVNSLTEEVLGSINQPMEFVPFYVDKILKISKLVGQKYELLRFEKITPENENLPWEDIEGNFKIKREKIYNVYAVIDGQYLPVVISFKSTSLKAGKKITTQMYAINMAAKKVAPCATVMELRGKKEQNEKGTFVVLEVASKKDSTPEQIAECAKWIKLIKQGAAKVDNSDEVVSEQATTNHGSLADSDF